MDYNDPPTILGALVFNKTYDYTIVALGSEGLITETFTSHPFLKHIRPEALRKQGFIIQSVTKN